MNSKNIEKRYDLIRMLLAIALAMGLVLLLIVLVSSKPLEAMGYFLTGPLKNTRRFFNVIEAAIPLVFTGLAVSMLFSANMSNMSTEGAFYMACAASSLLRGGAASACLLACGGLSAGRYGDRRDYRQYSRCAARQVGC